jgi:ABC-type uncharacterized transport system ATPase subunit
MEQIPVLEACNITKRFPGVLANDQVNFTLLPGEIHAILGENGAGKTTLLNIIYGLYHPDEGEIKINGQKVLIHGPNDAIKHGIGMVHQHFMLVEVFTIAENMILGEETVSGISLDIKTARRRTLELSKQYGLEVDPDALIEEVPVGVQQRVEILKALYRNAKILILDEPTAVLTPQEVVDLFKVMRQLTERGVSIIFISHKLKEVLEIADRITVMRRGQVVGTKIPEETDDHGLANMMVGREVLLEVEKGPAQPKEVVLSVKNLTLRSGAVLETVKDVSFEVRAGEILGIAGIQGNGQTELVEALTGLRQVYKGEMNLAGEAMTFQNPRNLVENGMAHIPEDRHKHGLVLPYSIADNLVLCTYYQPPFAKGITRNERAVAENATGLIDRFDVRTPSALLPAATLSGGNQQKVIVARELSRKVKLLVANQPTRGLDVGSIEYIHRQIVEMRNRGLGVLLVSAELDEIMGLSDRIAVMFRGQIVEVIDAAEATREQLGLLMAGSGIKM